MRNRSHRTQRHGFTLIELVMVLIILAILATAALNMVEVQVDQTRFETTQRTVDSVRDAILDEKVTGGGQTIYTGFVPDLGRLPQARLDTDDPTKLVLSELWEQQTLPAYGSLAAESVNLASTTDGDNDTIDADSAVFLTFGWRGPYLRLSAGARALHDGYGHELVSTVGASTGSHLRGDGDVPVAAAGDAVVAIRSFGRSNVEDPTSSEAEPYERDVPESSAGLPINSDQLHGTVKGIVRVIDSNLTTDQTSEITASNVSVQIFYPQGAEIAVQRADDQNAMEVSLAIANPGLKTFDVHFDDGSGMDFRFPIGPRVIRATVGTGTPEQSPVKTIHIVPGPNPDFTLTVDVNTDS
jgi:prepilin-type N-terminal cleavage/methylation domain-containing protein